MIKKANDQYAAWLAQATANKAALHYYDCPHCGASTATLTPPVGDVWNSFATCPYCAGLYFKVATNEKGTPAVNIQTVPEVVSG